MERSRSGTFQANRHVPIHRWYPYTEGFGSNFVKSELQALPEPAASVYDPFGGSGTTPLACSQAGVTSCYSEINPFMAFVTDMKVNGLRAAWQQWAELKRGLEQFAHDLRTAPQEPLPRDQAFYTGAFEGKHFFTPAVLDQILGVKELARRRPSSLLQTAFLRLALGCCIVPVSNMVRAADLRYAKESEKDPAEVDLRLTLSQKLGEMIADIEAAGSTVSRPTTLLSADARDVGPFHPLVDAVITSPPYLNGTNYIRNTKLELWMLEFIKSDKELHGLHSGGITAGINGVSRRMSPKREIPAVRPYVTALSEVAYDKRIPLMVQGYFSDMQDTFANLRSVLRPGGFLILDIGDSQFAGVHIPTHELLAEIAAEIGFAMYGETVLRTRRSKNGAILSQRVLRFRYQPR